ncbi:hypothetical protein [Pelagibius sp.]|uniref:hypothetical protein n=1 Tax=Pelagibius sp. TaxID=1931238 RepID=UPI00262A14CF|nr:hypothetical protein [Pelagibius sp.]
MAIPQYSRKVYFWTAAAVAIALGAAWMARALGPEPMIFDLSTATAVLGVFLISLVALYYSLSSRHAAAKGRSGGFAAKLGQGMVLILFGIAVSIAQIGIGYALADIVGFRTEFDYIEPYEVAAERSDRDRSVVLEARASHQFTLLNIVKRTGPPFWFALCAGPGKAAPLLPEDAEVLHRVEGRDVQLEADFRYDQHRDPPRRAECTVEELHIFLDVPERERICIDLRFPEGSQRSCWDLVRELDEDVVMLRDALRL